MSSDTNDLNIESDENTLKNLEAGVKVYENKLKDLEIAIEQFSSEFGIISEKLLDVLLIRDKLKKDWLPDITRGSVNLGLRINELDRELKINFRTINEKIKPKTKIEILASLEEFKELMEIISKDWWWKPEIHIRFNTIKNLSLDLFNFISLIFLGLSVSIVYQIVYGLSNGAFTVVSWGTLWSFFGSILTWLGLKDFLPNSVKNIISDFFNKSKNQPIHYRRFFKYKGKILSKELLVLITSLISFILLWFSKSIFASNLNNNIVSQSQFWTSKYNLEQARNQLKKAVTLSPDSVMLRKNLGDTYVDLYDYDNAIIEYKALLPDFYATASLIRLYILKSDKEKNSNYTDYITYLIYIFNISYNSLCLSYQHDNFFLKSKKCYYDDNFINEKYEEKQTKNNDYLIFVHNSYLFYSTRGWAEISQGKYKQAELDLQKSIKLINNALEYLKNRNSNTSDDDNIDLNSLESWERKQSQVYCLFFLLRNKQEKDKLLLNDRNSYKDKCSQYKPKSFNDWRRWTPEYYMLSNPDLKNMDNSQ